MNAEYYPTPRPVIAKMLNGIDARSLKAKQILEPQAGEGALLRQYEMTKSAYVGYIKARKELEFYSQGLIYSHNSVTKLADENYSPNLSASYNGFLNSFKSEAWSMILGKLNVGKFLTNSVMKDFEKYKKSQGAMDLTRENILSMVQMLIMNRGSIMEKAVVDVFDIFTKYHKENRCHVEGWKTNDYWKVNKKIILPYYLDDIRWSTYYSTSHRCYQEFADIEKVMCYLTGRDYAQTPSIKDFISKVRIGDSGEHESTFFYFRCYKKGTLHLRFKDEKLWEEFNRQACKGKMWLPD